MLFCCEYSNLLTIIGTYNQYEHMDYQYLDDKNNICTYINICIFNSISRNVLPKCPLFFNT